MTDLNAVHIIGRLTKSLSDDERNFCYTRTGQAKANISVAVNRGVKRNEKWEDEVSFFDVVIWGKTAENLKPYLQKGKQIAVNGYLKQDRWEKDGHKQSRVIINAENVWLLGSKNDNASNNSNVNSFSSENTSYEK